MLWPWNGGLMEDVEISGNDAHRGGGMYIENNYQLVTLRRLYVHDNTAYQGAGVYSRGTPLRMSNSLITRNEASSFGGGLMVHRSAAYPWTSSAPPPPIDPVAHVEFTVVHANLADAGQGLWIDAPNFNVDSSIFTGHTGNAVTVAQVEPPLPPEPPPPVVPPPGWTYNDTFPATFEGMSDPTGSSGNLSGDPAFMAPDTGDFQLAAGSMCVDAGNPAKNDPDGSRADIGMHAGPNAP
jgi:hypothetical protein